MAGVALRRFAHSLVVVFGVLTLVFLLLHIAPGDPVDLLLTSPYATEEDVRAMRAAFGLDRSPVAQYGALLVNTVRGEFGTSFYHGRPVMAIIVARLPATLELALLGAGATLLIAVPLGIVAALRRNTVADYVSSGVMFVGMATPPFWLGIVLIVVFSTHLGWLPTFGRGPALVPSMTRFLMGESSPLLESLRYLVLPVATLAVYYVAVIGQLTRADMLDEVRKDYIRVLRAKGVRERAIILRHALKNIAVPILTIFGLQLGSLLGGTVVIETVFSWPGLGLLLVQSITNRDYPMVQALVVLVSIGYIVINLLLDLTHAAIDPRVRA